MTDINELRRLAQAALVAPDGLSAEWMDRLGQFQEYVSPAAISELLDRLEETRAERDTLRYRCALESQENGALQEAIARACEERDELRAKIESMEKQKPVAFGLYSGWALKGTYLKEHEACEQRDRRQLTADLSGSLEAYRVAPLYALPGAKGEEK